MPSTAPQTPLPPNSSIAPRIPKLPLSQIKLQLKQAIGPANIPIEPLQCYSAGSSSQNFSDRLIQKVGRKLVIYDPETHSREFLDPNPLVYRQMSTAGGSNSYISPQSWSAKNTVVDVSHFTVYNNTLLSVCELVRQVVPVSNNNNSGGNNGESAIQLSSFPLNSSLTNSTSNTLQNNTFSTSSVILSQIGIYNLATNSRIKTLQYSSITKPYTCSSFCQDAKYVAALADESDKLIILWQLDKEKVYKTINLAQNANNFNINLLKSAPCNSLMLSTSGNSSLKVWGLSPDGNIKSCSILPNTIEKLENFIDHHWLAPLNSQGVNNETIVQYRLIVLSHPNSLNDLNINRKQNVYIFEGCENSSSDKNKKNMTSHKQGVSTPNFSFNLELRQTIQLKFESPLVKINKIIPSSKAFILIGSLGRVCIYEKTEEKHEPFIESRRLILNDMNFINGSIYPSEEKLILMSKTKRLLEVPLDMSIDQIKQGLNNSTNNSANNSTANDSQINNNSSMEVIDNSTNFNNIKLLQSKNSYGINDLTVGGHHVTSIISADVAFERSLIATLGSDGSLRIWNYLTGKCELLHYFKENEESLALAFHSSGFQILVSTNDRVILFNVLMDKLKSCRETIFKNCRVLSFSNGSQYWAGASGINLYVYETRNFTQLRTFQGHMTNISSLVWAQGDQLIFTSSNDGTIIAWPISEKEKIDIIKPNNRSSSILAIEIDSISTIFPLPNKDVNNGNENYDESSENSSNNEIINQNSLVQANIVSENSSSNNIFSRPDKKAMSSSDWITAVRSWLIFSSLDGHLRMPSFQIDFYNTSPKPLPSNSKDMILETLSNPSGNNPNGKAWLQFYPAMDTVPIIYSDNNILITAIKLTPERNRLLVGTNIGSIRVYPWPPDPALVPLYAPNQNINQSSTSSSSVILPSNSMVLSSNSVMSNGNSIMEDTSEEVLPYMANIAQAYLHSPYLCYETFCHAGSVVSIMMGSVDNMVISAGSDGSIFIHALFDETNKKLKNSNNILDLIDSENDNRILNNEVIFLAKQDIEDHNYQVQLLQKQFKETQLKYEIFGKKIEQEHNQKVKSLEDSHKALLQKENEMFEKQKYQYEKRIKELAQLVETKENDYKRIIQEVENKYKTKLSDQLDRYDSLSEEMTLLKQRCEIMLAEEKTTFDIESDKVKSDSKRIFEKLNKEGNKIVKDKVQNETSFQEILRQQEEEYEDEMRQLIVSTESVLVSKNEIISKLEVLQNDKSKNTSLLREKLAELEKVTQARSELLARVKESKKKLDDTIEHYKKNLQERKDALEEKEKLVLELKSKTRTLENFRFVLDHRLLQLSSERGPITSHIEGLEKHISTMYEELVEEFSMKKQISEASSLKEQKLLWLSSDLAKMKCTIKEKEEVIALFKKELNNIISSNLTGKDLEENIKLLYKKFVRGEATSSKSIMKLNSHIATTVNEMIHGKKLAKKMKNTTVFDFEASNNLGSKAKNYADYLYDTLDENSFYSDDDDDDDDRFNNFTTEEEHGHTTHAHNSTNNFNNNNNSGNYSKNQEPLSKILARHVDETLIDTVKEANRQKDYVNSLSKKLKSQLVKKEKDLFNDSTIKLNNNTDLLYECNELRVMNKELLRKIDVLQHDLSKTNRIIHEINMWKVNLKRQQTKKNNTLKRSNTSNISGKAEEQSPPTSAPSFSAPLKNDYIIHNSLVPSNSHLNNSKSTSTIVLSSTFNRNDPINLDNILIQSNSFQIKPKKPILSHSMPHLQPISNIKVEKVKKNVHNTAEFNNTTLNQSSLSSTHFSTLKPTELLKEIEKLSYNLEDVQRDKEILRLELKKIQKVSLSGSGSLHSGSGQLKSTSYANNNLDEFFNPLTYPSTPYLNYNPTYLNESPSLNSSTYADFHGIPSEQDLADIRVGKPGDIQSRPGTKPSSSSSYIKLKPSTGKKTPTIGKSIEAV